MSDMSRGRSIQGSKITVLLDGDEKAQLLGFVVPVWIAAVRMVLTMTENWTAPAVDRTESPNVAPERIAAEALLDYFRETLRWKCAGLSAQQLKQRSVPPSSMSLLGLVRHMAEVVRAWFRRRIAGEDIGLIFCSDAAPDGDFDDVDAADAEADFATYQREVDAALAVLTARSFDDTFTLTRRDGTGGTTTDIRAVVLHMIEEYAEALRACRPPSASASTGLPATEPSLRTGSPAALECVYA